MSLIERHRPRFTSAEAESLVKELYELEAIATPLPSERDQNFHLVTRSAGEFVLKISSSMGSRALLDFENDVLNHLATDAAEDLFPRVIASKTGESIHSIASSTGEVHSMRLLSHLPGVPMAQTNPHAPELLQNLGRFLATMDQSLRSFAQPVPNRDIPWDVDRAGSVILENLEYIAPSRQRKLLEQIMEVYTSSCVPHLSALPTSVIHNDANDHNILIRDGSVIAGIIDFGDSLHSYTVNELAVAAAYAMLGKIDPISIATTLVAAYHQVRSLKPLEVESLYPLICARLCVSVSLSARRRIESPDNEYLAISERPAWSLLEKLASTGPRLAHYAFRDACGMTPCPAATHVTKWLKANRDSFAPILPYDLMDAKILDLSVGSPLLENLSELADVDRFAAKLSQRITGSGARIGIGRYDEPRLLYQGEAFKENGIDGEEWRTIHIGIDLFADSGTPVHAPLGGTIHSLANNKAPLDYGPTILIEHNSGSVSFFTLYGHLSMESLAELRPGTPIRLGQQIGTIGDSKVNGGWPPHLHFQVIVDLLGHEGDFPGVARASQRNLWLSVCPNPNLMLSLQGRQPTRRHMVREQVLDSRRRLLGSPLSLAYRRPLHIVRGWRQYLFDETGRKFLDCVNNVCHVGHCHPRVVKALRQQAAVLNTNTRYLHENLVRYARRLCETLPPPLSVCFFVCSGSEANELALRLARTHTGGQEIVVVDGAYHGNTGGLVEISPYKFDGPGGSGRPAHVHKVPMPDLFRGLYRSDDPEAAGKYARHVKTIVKQLSEGDRRLAAFICESALGCGGQIILPNGYLRDAFDYVREGGGVCIVDEVQVGFGRVGSQFWAFETQGVVPDIVTMGKPMGNGHPLAAVVTTPEIAASFANGMEYFNTYGGNPVSCAVGMAVLDVLNQENLQDNAIHVGAHLKAELIRLMDRHRLIGDVRGLGLFIGIELVSDRSRRLPAPRETAYIVERMRDHGVLISSDGPDRNVLKIKPPMVFTRDDADMLVRTLDKVLEEDSLQVR